MKEGLTPSAAADHAILVQSTQALLDSVSPWIVEISILDWDGTQGYLPIIRRAILSRQFEFLESMFDLVRSDRGYAAVPLLRPACEELFWLRYLNRIPRHANALAGCLIESGLRNDLEAQAGEVGEEVMAEMGLLENLQMFRATSKETKKKLSTLGKTLGWPAQAIDKGTLPSTFYIAKQGGSEDLYRFLYHATSRYVHFSPVELGRRGWGKPGRLEISSKMYEPVWGRFSLSWGTRLFILTLNDSLEALRLEGIPEPDLASLQAASDRIFGVVLIPLVTREELRWP